MATTPTSEEELKLANDVFTTKIFQEVIALKENQSCVVSVLSILTPLTQLAIAAVGETHKEIISAIGFCCDAKTTDVIGEVNMMFQTVKGIELKQANKIYVHNDYTLNHEFAITTKDIFNSDVENIDFKQKEKAVNEINAWVEKKTNNRVKDIMTVESIDETTVAILVNAIYFKGKWIKPFLNSSTIDRQFHVTPDNTITIPMMYQRNDFKYKECPKLEAKMIEMDYEGGEASLIVVLPNQIDGINEFINKIKYPDELNRAIDSMSIEDVMISIPKFRVETATNLKEVLIKINIKQLFEPGKAELEYLVNESKDLFISSATQKTFIEVNEAGTEAAAATEMAVGLGVALNPNVKEFDADHPFAFFLMVKKNIMFCGIFRS